jgi:hypothetical protein
MTSLWAGLSRIEIPVGTRDRSFPKSSRLLLGPTHPLACLLATGGFFFFLGGGGGGVNWIEQDGEQLI